jgi:hypothetical protein
MSPKELFLHKGKLQFTKEKTFFSSENCELRDIVT